MRFRRRRPFAPGASHGAFDPRAFDEGPAAAVRPEDAREQAGAGGGGRLDGDGDGRDHLLGDGPFEGRAPSFVAGQAAVSAAAPEYLAGLLA
jgi:hypothetical protein